MATERTVSLTEIEEYSRLFAMEILEHVRASFQSMLDDRVSAYASLLGALYNFIPTEDGD